MGFEYYRGQLSVYCYEISKGTKPVAMIPVKTIYVEQLKEYVEKEKLYVSVEEVKGYPEWSTVYIFRDKYLKDVIKNAPDTPNSIYDHWVLGKLFGYSNADIKAYVSKLNDM